MNAKIISSRKITKSRAKSFIKIVSVVMIVLLLVIIAVKLIHTKKHHEAELEYDVTSPWRETVTIDKEYVAQISASQHIELRSLERGYLQNIYIDEGQRVAKGQKLFRIMPMLLESEFNKVKAEYELAKIEYDNTVILQEKDVVSVNELAITRKKLDKAKAEMDLAKNHLELATIKAPFDGYIDRFRVRLGSLIEEGELLSMLSDTSTLWAYFNVSEAKYYEYMELKKSKQDINVRLKLANGKIYPHHGKIDTIEADFNNETGNIAFRASFQNPNNILRHGITGVVLMSEQHENELLIPQKATYEILEKKYVYLVDNKNIVHSREIKIEDAIPNLFLVESGLSEKDRILISGVGQVREGQKIRIRNINSLDARNSLELPVE